jgi:hypothetical protein
VVTSLLVLLFGLFSIKNAAPPVYYAKSTTMLQFRQILYSVTLMLAVATSAVAQSEVKAKVKLPTWLKAKIATIEATPKFAEATVIWKLQYKDEDAYLFVAPCCDQFNTLYSATGVLLCSPNGGITGRGDGKCPDAITPKTKYVVVWRMPEADR